MAPLIFMPDDAIIAPCTTQLSDQKERVFANLPKNMAETTRCLH